MTPEPLEPLLALVRRPGARHLWVGEHPPFDFHPLHLLGSTNFRADPVHHQAYDVVWCCETPFTDLPPDQHLLLFDELVRFVGAAGLLVVRYHAGRGVLPLKTALGRRPGLRARVVYEDARVPDELTSVFEVSREGVERYRPGPWTFGVLTRNTRVDSVVRLLRSVRSHDPGRRHEVIVCGPEHPAYAFADPVYLPQVYSAEFADICRKKNDIARAASHPNLLIAHDRYVLADDFFPGFDRYGYDFDFATVVQRFEDGSDFPGYCHMPAGGLTVSPPRSITDLNSLSGTPFVNGGLFVAKTHLLRAVPLNELVFWNQAEDIELTVTLMRHGVAPRLNPYSTAVTVGIDRSHIAGFEPPAPPPAPPEPPPPPPPRPPLARRAMRLVRRRWKAAGALVLAVLLLAVLALQAATLYLLAGRGPA